MDNIELWQLQEDRSFRRVILALKGENGSGGSSVALSRFLSIPNTEVWITESGEWVAPVTGWFHVWMIGGGSGSAIISRQSDGYREARGGSAGRVRDFLIHLTAGQSVSVIIGAAGIGLDNSANVPLPATYHGGDTVFGDVSTADGPRLSNAMPAQQTRTADFHVYCDGAGIGGGTTSAGQRDGKFYGAGAGAYAPVAGYESVGGYGNGAQGVVRVRYYDPGKDTDGSVSFQLNRKITITESGNWVSPVTGWARVTCIGGGGAGGTQSAANGVQSCGGGGGGTTSFGTFVSALGGAGGSGGSTMCGGGGGGPGKVETDYVFVVAGQAYPLTIGAGGQIRTAPALPGGPDASGLQDLASAGQGARNAVGGSLRDYSVYGIGDTLELYHGNGGNGGWNGTPYGGGGGGHCGGTGGTGGTNHAGFIGLGGGNGEDGAPNNGTPHSNKGGNGGPGAIIIELCDTSRVENEQENA